MHNLIGTILFLKSVTIVLLIRHFGSLAIVKVNQPILKTTKFHLFLRNGEKKTFLSFVTEFGSALKNNIVDISILGDTSILRDTSIHGSAKVDRVQGAQKVDVQGQDGIDVEYINSVIR